MNAALRRIALGLGLAVIAIASWLMRGDGPPPDDADLSTLPPPVADHDNGFLSLSAASELLQWPESEEGNARLEGLVGGDAWDAELAARVLAANDAALEAFDRAARRESFQSPPIRDLANDVPDMLPWIRLAQLSGLRALAAAHAGDGTAATASALSPVRLGRQVSGNPNGALISGTVGLKIGARGLDALEASIPMLSITPEASRALTAQLAALHIEPDSWRAMWASEYRTVRPLFAAKDAASVLDEQALASMGWIARWLPASYLYQPNNSLAAYASHVRALQAAAGAACRPPAAPERLSRLSLLGLPNGAGRLAAETSEPLTRFDARRCEHATHLEAVRAAVALRAFELERGVLPPSLDALVPTYLETAPRDWFSDEPLRLDRTNRVIYSIGSDGIDGGGRALADDTEFREPRFPVRAQSQPSPM